MARRRHKNRSRNRSSAPAPRARSRRRRSGGGGRVQHHRKSPSLFWKFVKIAGGTIIGGAVGALAAPLLPEAVSGTAVGMGLGGLAMGGFKPGAVPALAAAAGVQGVHTLARTETFGKFQVAAIKAAGDVKRQIGSGGGGGIAGDAAKAAADAIGEKALGGGIANDIRQARKIIDLVKP